MWPVTAAARWEERQTLPTPELFLGQKVKNLEKIILKGFGAFLKLWIRWRIEINCWLFVKRTFRHEGILFWHVITCISVKSNRYVRFQNRLTKTETQLYVKMLAVSLYNWQHVVLISQKTCWTVNPGIWRLPWLWLSIAWHLRHWFSGSVT